VVTKNVGYSMFTKKTEMCKEIMTLNIKQNKKRGGGKIGVMKRPRYLSCQTK
jgi:hypothetical protein